MIDIIGPRLSKLGMQFPFLQFTPDQESKIIELIGKLEQVFKEAEAKVA